jgi:hypothetical protein
VIILAEEYPQIKLNYSRDLEIDQYNLELELLAIAKQIMAYSEAHVQAQFNRDRAKQRRDVAEAELDLVARSEPYPEDIPISAKTGQPTETAVVNWIHKQSKYQEAQLQRQQDEYVVNMLQAAVFAFQAKKTALENLVRLFGMKYYAEPYDQPGSDLKAKGMEQGRLAATEAMRKLPVDGNTPKASVNLGPVPTLTTDKDGHRYAIGLAQAPFQGAFTFGPFPELQQALDCPGTSGLGIYRLTRERPDELIYVWDMKLNGSADWIKEPSETTSRPTSLPPRPPQRPLPKAK